SAKPAGKLRRHGCQVLIPASEAGRRAGPITEPRPQHVGIDRKTRHVRSFNRRGNGDLVVVFVSAVLAGPEDTLRNLRRGHNLLNYSASVPASVPAGLSPRPVRMTG